MVGTDVAVPPAEPPQSSLAAMLRSISDAVPMSNSRERILETLDGLARGYETNDIESRVALFAPAIVFEDPLGVPRASNHAELREFYRSATAGGISLDRKVEDRVIIHDQAIERAVVTVYAPDQMLVHVHLYTHFVFDSAGLITSYKVFFDRESITS